MPLTQEEANAANAALNPKIKALELAIAGGGSHTDVLERAKHYHSFLTGSTAAAVTAAPKTATAPAAAPKTAETKPATAPKATPAPGTKPATATKPGAATPKATTAAPAKAAASAPPPGDTKDPNGNNTYNDVVAALQKVMGSVQGDDDKKTKGRALAYALLAEKGKGVSGVRDLKPELYDTVVAACEEQVKKSAAPAKKPAAVASAAVDDFGMPIDTSGASAATVDESDPPEGGSGEDI